MLTLTLQDRIAEAERRIKAGSGNAKVSTTGKGSLDTCDNSIRLGLNRRSFDRRTLFGRASSWHHFVKGSQGTVNCFLIWM